MKFLLTYTAKPNNQTRGFHCNVWTTSIVPIEQFFRTEKLPATGFTELLQFPVTVKRKLCNTSLNWQYYSKVYYS